MTLPVTFFNTGTTIYGPNGSVDFYPIIPLNRNKKYKMRMLKAAISVNIPNVYNFNGTNNGLLRVSNDGGVTWTNIQLENGIYSVAYINDAIVSTLVETLGWCTKDNPCFSLEANLATQKLYISIDSTQLISGTAFAIDFSVSDIYTLLGCVTTKTFTSDTSITTFSDFPKIDYWGNSINIYIDGIGSISNYNGKQSSLLYILNAIKYNENQNEYVSGLDGSICSPFLIDVSGSLSRISFRFTGTTGQPIYLLNGDTTVQLELSEV